ncbi:MAG: BrnT family toxin [gamma proteobacterium symbiont of Taylorina sp.]|nr:BrnT family toxin [gamma proteobacterium symbiont of Taylorina sp.]
MQFNWDENKNKTNLVNHGISFETAKLIFDDPYALSTQDRYEDGEERWQTIGLINGIIIILVAHTFYEHDNNETIRIISARKATRQERKYYEQNI